MAWSLMIQGTASGVGKSVIVAGLCRLLWRRGMRVAPFKPQNMSNNAAVTVDGGEIGRAQALQALACGIEPVVDMNPVLIKPEADHTAQLIVRGQVTGRLQAQRFREDRIALLDTVLESYAHLCQQYDYVLIEGAGSPAEPNLRQGDIANMGFAEAADVPVCLLGDIHCGGVFAALQGTLEVLTSAERERVQALMINRFRGSRVLLSDALQWLEQRSGKPIAGIIPWLELDLPEEDMHRRQSSSDEVKQRFQVVVVAYPRMSNHDDVNPLASDPQVQLRFAHRAEDLLAADLIILPGSKHVATDLFWLRSHQMEQLLLRHLRFGGHILGICGGLQMLGEVIHDDGVEGESVNGLGLLPIQTHMQAEKTLRRVHQTAAYPADGGLVQGYEIHHGASAHDDALFPFAVRDNSGQVWGSYVHGLLDEGLFRQRWLAQLGFDHADAINQQQRTLSSLDHLADVLEEEVSVILP